MFVSMRALKLRKSTCIAVCMGGWYAQAKWSASQMDPVGKVILITGCDSGFGLSLATELDKIGMTVFAGCLDINSRGAMQLKQDQKGKYITDMFNNRISPNCLKRYNILYTYT